MATVQGQYLGKDIYAGDDAYVASQMKAIDAASAPKPVATAPQPSTVAPSPTQTMQQAPTTQPTQTTQPTAQPTQQTQATQPTQQPQQASLAMPSNGSVVDLLNMAGKDSSQAARKQLAKEYGINNYDFSAAKNTELAQKFLEAFNANKGTKAPASGAEGKMALDNYFGGQTTDTTKDSDKKYFDIKGSMNPIEASIFDGISQAFSAVNTQKSLREEIMALPEFTERQGLRTELLDMKRIMEGTEDDIREEVQSTGGLATDSQIRALAGARNKNLLKQSNNLIDQLTVLDDYIDQVTTLTKADRDQLQQDFENKLGLGKTMFDMADRMDSAAKENYQAIIRETGYDSLVDSVSSPQELAQIANSLGMSPQMLMQLGSQKTSAQRAQQLDEMNYQLSVDKFNEDKRQFGLSHALSQYKAQQEFAAKTVVSPYQVEKTTRNLDSINSLLPKVSSAVVGVGSYGAYIPGTAARNFDSEVQALKANIAFSELTAMREASKTGGALGAISDRELNLLQSSLGSLDTGQSPTAFKKSLETVRENIYRWNAQALSLGNGYDYAGLKKEGYTDEEIYNYFNN